MKSGERGRVGGQVHANILHARLRAKCFFHSQHTARAGHALDAQRQRLLPDAEAGTFDGGDGQQLLVWGDIVHNHAVQFAKPEVVIEFDVDSDKARDGYDKKTMATCTS